MKEITCMFIGHRSCCDLDPVRLSEAIDFMIKSNKVKTFLNGGMGAFDRMSAFRVNQIRRERGVHSELIIPYRSFRICDPGWFDEIVLPEESENAHYRRAIILRNEYMIRRSRYAICYVDTKNSILTSGALRVYQKAREAGLIIVNLFND